MATIPINKIQLKNLCENRKMDFDQIASTYEQSESNLMINTYVEIEEIAARLNVPIAELFRQPTNDLENGIKLCREGTGFSRTSERNGIKYYIYNHLATTNMDPSLMCLKVDVQCTDASLIALNDGHSSKELIYVTKGTIRMDWKINEAEFTETLNQGDSVFISPNVPHSFIAVGEKAEIIAFNYQ